MSNEQEQPKPNPQLDAGRFKEAAQVRNEWAITVEQGLTRAQITHPDFLAHIATKLRPYDRIEVRCDDGSMFADLLVLEAARTYARTRVLHWVDLTTSDVAKSQDEKAAAVLDPALAYRVEYKGPHLKWVAIRNSDGAVLRETEPDKKSVQAWLDDYVRVTA